MSGEIRLLIPGVCHPIASETLERLRGAAAEALYIVGVDLEERGYDYEGVDAYYHVPPATSPDFISVLLDICRRERIRVVAPWSDLEVEAVSGAAGEFDAAGVATLCGSATSVRLALHKGRALERLREHDIPVPAFEVASSAEQVEAAARTLGYPRSTVVVNLCRSSGCRGLWFLSPDGDLLQRCHGPGQQATLSTFLAILRDAQRLGREIPEFVVTEFLQGDDYSVDALARDGEAVYVVPRRRLQVTEGISRVGEIVPNPEVRSLVVRVIAALGLHLNVNVQMKYAQPQGGTPRVYEINPRVSGSVVANDGAGAALFYYGVRLALGRPIPPASEVRLRRTRMVRRWIGSYSQNDESFTP